MPLNDSEDIIEVGAHRAFYCADVYRKRQHSALGYLMLVEFEKRHLS